MSTWAVLSTRVSRDRCFREFFLLLRLPAVWNVGTRLYLDSFFLRRREEEEEEEEDDNGIEIKETSVINYAVEWKCFFSMKNVESSWNTIAW